MGGFAWVTLATNDSYSLGALVLAHSLRRVNTAHHLVALITPGVTEAMKTQLSAVFDVVKLVDVLDSGDADNLALLARPELGITFTKLHCWKLTDYDKCVFLDADTLILQNSDELFEREELSAAPDAGWPDCFNSGVFVYRPSNETFKSLIEFALIHGSFDGGDQGLLNLFFSDWPTKDIKKHLPFVYNMCSTSTYSYLPAFKQFGKGLKIIHFIGAAKPWLQPFNTETALARVSGESQHVTQFVQFWWDLFCTHVHPSLSTEMAGLAAALATVTLGAPLSTEQTALEEHLRRQGWEQGNIDYMGKDSFANIWGKICDTLASSTRLSPMPTEEAPTPVAPVAAPVFVSSVEMSPTGPIDTSPPANYAPVSASKTTTVVASDIEAATKAAPSETATVIPEPKSPSVTELVSTEASISSTAALDTSAQPSTPVSAVSEPSATVSQREASTSLTPSSSSTVLTETAPVLVAQIPAVETFPVASAPVTTISSGLIPAVLPPATILPTTDSTSASIVPIPTSAEIPVSVQPTLKDTPVSTSQTQVTVIATSTETLLPKPVEVSEPITPTSTETLIPKPTESSGSILHTPNEIPVSSSQLLSPVPDKPPKTSVSSTVPPSKTPVTTTKAEVEAPAHVPPTPSVVPAPIASAPVATESNVESTPASTKSIPSTVSTAPPSKPSDVGAQVPVQPDTPTVTEPTPPTSPPAAPVEAPLAAKLQVETEVPATPPVGSSSTQPSLAAAPTEEPPIPPKRKGGSKATQEVKNQKGGKQTKSKK